MKVALCADEPHAVHQVLHDEITRRGHTVVRFGALETGTEQPWALVAEGAAMAVATGDCAEGIFLCWTGTGISMAANKVSGIRAALCTDAPTAQAAREWNHANVLCLSHRLLTGDLAREILAAWFDGAITDRGVAGVRAMNEVDARHRSFRTGQTEHGTD